jgi:butyrate kinase
MFRILVINPGSTSTKVALYEDEKALWMMNLPYSREQLSVFEKTTDQIDIRRDDILEILRSKNVELKSLSAVVGRGGPFKPLESGTYEIDEHLLKDILSGNVQADHISNIGALLAYEIAGKQGLPAFFVDPVSVDEFEPVARISGIPELERVSLLHALNIKATAIKAAKELGRPFNKLNLIVAHLGGGISICAIQKGRIVDVNNANEGGPFSPERYGYLPVTSLVKLCYSKKFTLEEMKKRLVGNGGIVAYLGTNDVQEVEKRIHEGDEKALLIYEAMAYQISKEIGGMAAVLKCNIDAILLTGGIAHSAMLVDWIKQRVGILAHISVYAGENEMEALALGALRVLRKEEQARLY